jgi:asparagine synthase (glutamine-hydrolysing)
MLAAQEIYGPHDGRQWAAGPVAMGRRLFRTLPEDRHDRQPLHGGDGRLTLVADVRLDNRDELEVELGLDAGQLCDAAILLEALVRWEEAALDRIVGDFAFALWDDRKRRLLLARDFLGQRPLHYHRGDGFFAFATMPKGLHALPEIPYAPDEQAMAEYIALLPPDGTRSFFAGIVPVQAGHVVTVSAEGIAGRRYWNPSPPAPGAKRRTDYAEGLRHHLDLATRSRLRGANGAVGAHLSGGYDSAAVAATAARLLAPEGGKVVAFTAVPREGYDGPCPTNRIADEGPLAAATAALYPNMEHVLIRTGHLSPVEDIDRNYFLFDHPILNLCNLVWAKAINVAARERRLTVVLTGQMGNMSLSYNGLESLPEMLRSGRWAKLARESAMLIARGRLGWRTVLAHTFGPFMPPRLWQGINRLFRRRWDILHYTALRPDRLQALDLPKLAAERALDFSFRPRTGAFGSRLWGLRRTDLGTYYKGMLGGWGIDQRDPTADRRLVEYCLGVPADEFLANGEIRALACRALGDRLPPEVIDERGKGYQAADWHEGFRAARAEFADEIERFAACAPAASTLDIDKLRKLVEDWPETGWHRQDLIASYRLALGRGISAGHFLRKAARSNS